MDGLDYWSGHDDGANLSAMRVDPASIIYCQTMKTNSLYIMASNLVVRRSCLVRLEAPALSFRVIIG